MSMTPGPWLYDMDECQVYAQLPKGHPDRWSNDPDLDSGKRNVLCTYGALGGEDSVSDLSLIVAAPELLAALDAACDWILNEMERVYGREMKPSEMPAQWKSAQAAMRKARGETPEGQSDAK